MIRNIIFIFIVTIIISSCGGYEPIYSEKDFNFKLGKILTSGNKELNKTLIRNIKNIEKKNVKNSKVLDLEINTKLEKKIKSKDTKGNPNTFEMTVTANLMVRENEKNTLMKNFLYSNIYNALNSEFELKKYEKTVEKNLGTKISEKIIIYLQTLN